MNFEDLQPEQRYFYDLAWSNLRLAYDMVKQGRKAKAQETKKVEIREGMN